MSQSVRPEDLEVGVQFQVEVLGTVSLGQATSADLASVQKPLRDLYFAYQKPTGPQPLPVCSLVVSNRGLAISDASNQGGVPAAETLYNIPSIGFTAAVKFANIGKKEKDFKCAFEAIEVDQPKGKDDLFVSLDKKSRYLAKITSHPALCVCTIQRMTGVKALEMHVFVCQSDGQARDFIFCLTSASRNFAAKETSGSAIYGGYGVYDFGRPAAGPGFANGFGPRVDGGDNLLAVSKPGLQKNGSGGVMMAGAGGEGVYGGFQRYPDLTQITKPAGGMMDPGPWDRISRENEPQPIAQSGGGGWLNQQKHQLMQNFNDDQRKHELQQKVGLPGQDQGVYDPQGRVIYDTHPNVYEYRAPKDIYGPTPQTENVYGLRRDLYDPPNEQSVYGQSRNMMPDSYEAQKFKEGTEREEQSKQFLIPRTHYNYEGASGRNSPLPGNDFGASQMRPSSFIFDSGKQQQQQVSESSIDRKLKSSKAPPPTPSAKKQPTSPTSPIYETTATSKAYGGGNAGLVKQEKEEILSEQLSHHDAQSIGTTVAPRKVAGIKVFPTIMLKGNQVAKAAAAGAASDDGDNIERRLPSKMAETSRLVKQQQQQAADGGTDKQKGKPTEVPEERNNSKTRRDEEIESAFGGLSLDPGRSSRNSNDFEQSLGYFP